MLVPTAQCRLLLINKQRSWFPAGSRKIHENVHTFSLIRLRYHFYDRPLRLWRFWLDLLLYSALATIFGQNEHRNDKSNDGTPKWPPINPHMQPITMDPVGITKLRRIFPQILRAWRLRTFVRARCAVAAICKNLKTPMYDAHN